MDEERGGGGGGPMVPEDMGRPSCRVAVGMEALPGVMPYPWVAGEGMGTDGCGVPLGREVRRSN